MVGASCRIVEGSHEALGICSDTRGIDGAGDASAQQARPAAKDQLVGTWMLTRWWNVADDGHEMPQPIDGKDMKGLLMFDSTGHYSLVIASDRPKWKSPDRMEGTPDENRAAARGTLAYFGTYSVNELDQTFTLHVDRSLHPNINGTDQKRFFRFRATR
jgi:lipocalin-like protein